MQNNDYVLKKSVTIHVQMLLFLFFPIFWLSVNNVHPYPWCYMGKYGIAIGRVVFFVITFLFFALLYFLQKDSAAKNKMQHPYFYVISNYLNKGTQYELMIFKLYVCLQLLMLVPFYHAGQKLYLQLGYVFPYIHFVLFLFFLMMAGIISYLFYPTLLQKNKFIAGNSKFLDLDREFSPRCGNGGVDVNWQRKFSIKVFYALAGSFFLATYLFSMYYFPFDPRRADMLNAIYHAIGNFMANISPYTPSIKVFAKSVSLTIGAPPYLPITLISFIPAYILHVNIMLMNFIYYLMMSVIIWVEFDKLSALGKYLICLCFLNPYFINHAEIYLSLFMLEICVIRFYLDKIPDAILDVFLGVFIASIQFAWVIYPFLLLKTSRTKSRLLVRMVLSILVFLSISYYFSHGYIQQYIQAVFIHNTDVTRPFGKDFTFGFGQIFYFFTNQKILYFSQIIIYLIILGYAVFLWLKKQYCTDFIALSAIAYFIFLATNYFLETYLYIPALFFIAIL